MNLKKWNTELVKGGYELIHSAKYFMIFYNHADKSKVLIGIHKRGKVHKVTYTVGLQVVLSFTDTLLKKSKKDESFNRVLDNGNVVTYANGVQQNLISNSGSTGSVPFMQPIPKDETISQNNFITLDLETRKLPTGDLEVISAVFYTGTDYFTYFLTDFHSTESMLRQMVEDLFLKSSQSTNIYVHNFSGFDSIFLLGILADYASTFSLNRREDKIITLTTKSLEHKTTLVFKDSMLLLPASLEELGKGFGVSAKGSYDHNKSNTTTDLNLIKAELLAYNKQCQLALSSLTSSNLYVPRFSL